MRHVPTTHATRHDGDAAADAARARYDAAADAYRTLGTADAYRRLWAASADAYLLGIIERRPTAPAASEATT